MVPSKQAKGGNMRAIDRATRWSQYLQEAGFTVEVHRNMAFGTEWSDFKATLGPRSIWFSINMDSPRTRFGAGGSAFYGSARHTTSPGAMAQMIFSEIEMVNYTRRQEVSA